MSDELNRKIEQAEGRVGQLRGDLRAAEKSRDELYCLRSKRDYGVEPGVRVKDRKGEALVVAVWPESYARHKPRLYVNRFKKDGTPSAREETMYSNWELVAPQGAKP